MSLILDALKRAERERQADATPAPDAVAAPAAQPARRPRAWIGVAVIVAGLLVAAALLWDAFRDKPGPVPPPEAQAQPPVIVARPAPSVQEPAPAVVPGTEAVTSLDDLTDEATLEAGPQPLPEPAQKPVPPTAIATRPAPPPTTSPPQEIRASPAPAPAPPVTKSGPTATPQAAPPTEIPPALTQPAPLKKFREMPPEYRADFPALKIEIHVYEKTSAQRFVMVNGRKYREGERLAEGPTLIEIAPDGIVLEYRGERVLYTLGR